VSFLAPQTTDVAHRARGVDFDEQDFDQQRQRNSQDRAERPSNQPTNTSAAMIVFVDSSTESPMKCGWTCARRDCRQPRTLFMVFHR
jgi:hypothetical protein